jgi:hypothetical protein
MRRIGLKGAGQLAAIDAAVEELRTTLKTKEECADHSKHSSEPEGASK